VSFSLVCYTHGSHLIDEKYPFFLFSSAAYKVHPSLQKGIEDVLMEHPDIQRQFQLGSATSPDGLVSFEPPSNTETIDAWLEAARNGNKLALLDLFALQAHIQVWSPDLLSTTACNL
jgi:hypothetical protein